MYRYNIHYMAKARKAINTEFKSQERFIPRNQKERALIKTLTRLKDEKAMAALLRDMMTLAEIEEFSNRLEIARLILKGKSYQKIAEEVNVSTSTVTRVGHWLFSGCGGYQAVFKKNYPKPKGSK